jgi:enamine deaminase RidA (YjgF/YER057c/UK114 family)
VTGPAGSARSGAAEPDLRIGSGGPWEDRFGYSRVRRVGPLAITAGCTATVDGQPAHPGGAGAQARVAFEVALRALAEAGLAAEQVIASRMYVTDRADTESVGAAHGEIFGQIRPAATMVIVAGLIDPALRVEVELVAWAG